MTRIRRLMVGIFAILSLSVSSVAACACSHHEPTDSQPERSCHGKPVQSHGKPLDKHRKHSDQTNRSTTVGETCSCLPVASKASVKAEGFKLKKQIATFVGGFVPEVGEHYVIATSIIEQGTVTSASDPHLSSIFSRGPPAS